MAYGHLSKRFIVHSLRVCQPRSTHRVSAHRRCSLFVFYPFIAPIASTFSAAAPPSLSLLPSQPPSPLPPIPPHPPHPLSHHHQHAKNERAQAASNQRQTQLRRVKRAAADQETLEETDIRLQELNHKNKALTNFLLHFVDGNVHLEVAVNEAMESVGLKFPSRAPSVSSRASSVASMRDFAGESGTHARAPYAVMNDEKNNQSAATRPDSGRISSQSFVC
jgi:hypothetical protein